MGNDTIISVENLGKLYRLGTGRSNERYTALRDVITDKAKSLFRRTPLTSDPPTDGFAVANLRSANGRIRRGEPPTSVAER